MNSRHSDTIRAGALALIEAHFRAINEGDTSTVRQQLYFPPNIKDDPVNVYIRTMQQLTPFTLLEATVVRIDAARQMATWGIANSVLIHVLAECALGKKSTDFTVWHSIENEQYIIASRPSEWVLEKVRDDETHQN